MEDMFLKQMRGRFKSHQLNIQTIINPQIEAFSKIDVESYTKREMTMHLADAIINSPKHVTYTVSDHDPNYMGKMVRMSTYCMSESGFKKVITDAYNAGLESAWTIEK